MKLSKIMDNHNIYVGIHSVSKRQLLQELSEKASKFVNIDSRNIFDALLERENLGSTGFGNGTAVPHARIDKLKDICAFFAKLDKPIDFDSVDGKPVDLVFLLLSPEGNGADHLTALARISRALKNENVRNQIRKEDKIEKIYSILDNAE